MVDFLSFTNAVECHEGERKDDNLMMKKKKWLEDGIESKQKIINYFLLFSVSVSL